MIQVIERAFKILTEIADDPKKVWKISELAEIINVPSPTCFHIVNSMVQIGMIERVGMRKGYRLGAGINQLCHSNIYTAQIAQVAESMFRKFVLDFKGLIEFIVLHGFQRHILCHASPEHILRVDYNLQTVDDVMRTASGQYLLAHESREKQKDFYEHVMPYELPKDAEDLWPYGLEYENYLRTLDEKKGKPNVIRENVKGKTQIIFPVFSQKGEVNAVVAAVIPAYLFQGAFRENLLTDLFRISNELSMAQSN